MPIYDHSSRRGAAVNKNNFKGGFLMIPSAPDNDFLTFQRQTLDKSSQDVRDFVAGSNIFMRKYASYGDTLYS